MRTHRTDITVRRLSKERIQVYLAMLLQRARWLESIRQPMWNIDNLHPANFEKMYPGYMPYLIYRKNTVVGGFILLKQDRFLWSEEENKQSAFYIHKLVVKPEFAGRGYAHKSISRIKEMALREGVSYLRLDCYEDRAYLMKLYEECGFYKKRKTIMEDGTALQSFEYALSQTELCA